MDDAAAAGRSVIDGGDESTAPGPLLLLPEPKINHLLVVETYNYHLSSLVIFIRNQILMIFIKNSPL